MKTIAKKFLSCKTTKGRQKIYLFILENEQLKKDFMIELDYMFG